MRTKTGYDKIRIEIRDRAANTIPLHNTAFKSGRLRKAGTEIDRTFLWAVYFFLLWVSAMIPTINVRSPIMNIPKSTISVKASFTSTGITSPRETSRPPLLANELYIQIITYRTHLCLLWVVRSSNLLWSSCLVKIASDKLTKQLCLKTMIRISSLHKEPPLRLAFPPPRVQFRPGRFPL